MHNDLSYVTAGKIKRWSRGDQAGYHVGMNSGSPHTLRRAANILLQLGGEEPSGWLPPGAAKPLPTPLREVLVDLEIEGDGGGGYLLIFQAQDGSFCWDNWYESIEGAVLAAEEYGVEASKWVPVNRISD